MSLAAFKANLLANHLTSHSDSDVDVWYDNGVIKVAVQPVLGVNTPAQATLDAIVLEAQDYGQVYSSNSVNLPVVSGSVTLETGGAGSVDSIEVNGVEIMSGAVVFNADLATTASDVAADINGNTSSPNYNAVAQGTTIIITPVDSTDASGYSVVSSATTITTTDVNMSGTPVTIKVEFELLAPRNYNVTYDGFPAPSKYES